MFRKISVISTAFILLLIVFDTFQQKYYVDTFLSPDSEYTLLGLLSRHSMSWIGWLIFGLPFVYLLKQLVSKDPHNVDTSDRLKMLAMVLLHIVLSLMSISAIRLFVLDLGIDRFEEFFIFHFYQKSLVFLMADATVIILIFNTAKDSIIQSQYIEIKVLEESRDTINNKLNAGLDIPQMIIRTGNRIDRILITDIVWVQSDDYCCKIHTVGDRNFSLRKSLKSLEKSLSPYGFVRIHRSAILNLNTVSQLNLDKSIVKLKNDLELPVSKSRVSALRESLSKISV